MFFSQSQVIPKRLTRTFFVLFVFQAARQKLKKEHSTTLGMIRILIKCVGKSSGWTDYFYLAVRVFLCDFVLRHQDKTNIILPGVFFLFAFFFT